MGNFFYLIGLVFMFGFFILVVIIGLDNINGNGNNFVYSYNNGLDINVFLDDWINFGNEMWYLFIGLVFF